jgi:hypothetical protein
VFHSCVVVDLWQSLSEWHLLLSACFGVSELELEQQTNTKFLVKLGQSGNEIREMLVQVYGDNAMKKTAVFLREEKVSLTKRDQDDQQHAELKKIKKIVLKGVLGAGIGAQLPKGSTLKVTTVVFSDEVCSTFTAMSSRTL